MRKLFFNYISSHSFGNHVTCFEITSVKQLSLFYEDMKLTVGFHIISNVKIAKKNYKE